MPEGNTYSGRLTLQFEPSDRFEAELKVLGSYEKLNSSSAFAETFCTAGKTVPVATLNTPLPGADCRLDQVKAESALPAVYAANYPNGNGGVPFFKSQAWLASLSMSFDLTDAISLASTTGYYNQHVTDNRNGDFSPLALIWAGQEERSI